MDYIRITDRDNVAVALSPLQKGSTAAGVTLLCDIPAGHKFALCGIPRGTDIIKYNAPIGCAAEDIAAGAWVHTHNVRTNLSDVLDYTYTPTNPLLPPQPTRTFRGFRRSGGRVGIRNEIWIIPTVGCVNSPAQRLAQEGASLVHGTVDGIYAFPHPYGCSQLGDDHKNTQRALAGLVHHPNAGGVLVLGLGCENNNIAAFRTVLGDIDETRVKFLNCQEVDDEIAAGRQLLRELCDTAADDTREDIDASELIVGLKCGGSDGYSGITANPCVGVFSDRLIAQGGCAILTEVPEMFGAEQLLMARCENKALFDKTVSLINDFKRYFQRYGQPVYENPSPGNKAGGITTLEDKSLGCTQKSGSAPVCAVIGYGERTETRGLHLLSAPGNDLVASTALAISGAHLVLFTTGRGTPFGCPVPTVKISSNSALAQKKNNWIDFDAGVICETGDIRTCGDALFDYVLALASGDIRTKNEEMGYRDISIFKDGVTL
ncbi:MAG: altronate dehydratase [Ruminococcaceae bacterium]|nr:altronate dehydratase [Oscillospiraceae bacterium]